VDVGAEAYIVGQVPADVIGVVIDHDVVAVPKPAIAQADLERRDAPEEAAEAESARSAAAETPYMLGADSSCEPAVLPGFIEVEMRIVLTGIVPDPLAGGVDVWSFGVARLIGWPFGFLRSGGSSFCGRGALRRYVPVAYLAASLFFFAPLRKRQANTQDSSR